jgi:hypothetical protein
MPELVRMYASPGVRYASIDDRGRVAEYPLNLFLSGRCEPRPIHWTAAAFGQTVYSNSSGRTSRITCWKTAFGADARTCR